ncbi:MAG: iron uptake porin, partial [Halothece sp. Uz-M2-17]|nr:iron uptake porin [Halothece sp. Uz-M2-17]
MPDLGKQGLAVFGIMTILFNGGNVAQGQSLTDRTQRNDSSQVNNVFELKDVSPDDWAFEALRNLIERYGCLAGSPDGRFNGNRALTRYEFAAALEQCLPQIEDLISNNSREVTEADLATLQRLTKNFEAELATLSTRVDNLEARTTVLEDNQFSTTTKLRGTVLFSVNSAFGNNRAVPVFADANDAPDIDEGVVFNNRVRLNFDSSFTGRDLLKVRLDATDVTRFNAAGTTGTNITRLAFDRNTDGNVVLGKLFYTAAVGERFSYAIDASRGRFNAHIDNFNGFFANAVKGSISNFGRMNPIYIQGATGAGISMNYQLSDSLTLSGGYLARNASNVNQGLFNGSYAALGQLAFYPNDNLSLGLTYVR